MWPRPNRLYCLFGVVWFFVLVVVVVVVFGDKVSL